mmetsp:Transcript_14412/g.25521  ORF Transcript_14412/g.25521 Transcript_14412/m.25521 type:complete len:206 (+) Transcript_14412:2835-3452(+)
MRTRGASLCERLTLNVIKISVAARRAWKTLRLHAQDCRGCVCFCLLGHVGDARDVGIFEEVAWATISAEIVVARHTDVLEVQRFPSTFTRLDGYSSPPWYPPHYLSSAPCFSTFWHLCLQLVAHEIQSCIIHNVFRPHLKNEVAPNQFELAYSRCDFKLLVAIFRLYERGRIPLEADSAWHFCGWLHALQNFCDTQLFVSSVLKQ